MISENLIFLIVAILGVEVVVPWYTAITRSRSDEATSMDVLRNVLTYSPIEAVGKITAYAVAILAFHVEKIAPYSALIVMFVGGVNLFYLRKGQPKG